MFRPRFFETIKNYSKEQFFADLTAGIIVGIVAIPLSIAFAIASGVGPEKGFYTAIIAGFIISLLGGSNVQIGGPTGAFIVIIYGIVLKYGLNGLIIATIMAGIILIIMGSVKLGTLIQFIPYPVIVGFTGGIALIIFSSQINDLLGLGIEKVPAGFIEKWVVYFNHFGTINYWSLGIGLSTVVVILLWQKISKKIPGALVALILATLAVTIFNLPVETIGKRFGEISSSIPIPVFPKVTFEQITELAAPAFTIAMLAGIESLLSAVVADGMIGKKHNSNTELIALGIANIGSSLFGGIPATGAIARTATNVKNGGRTPVAGMVHAIVLLLVLLFFGKLAALIPMACLAGILLVVSYNMSEWRSFKAIMKCPKSDIAVLFTTFFLTVLIDLTVAITYGIILALLLFMRRMSLVSNINVIKDEFMEEKEINDPLSINRINIPAGVEIYEINGPFFFGAAEKFKEEMLKMENQPKIRIIRMRHVPAIDSSGLKILEDINKDSVKRGTTLILSGVSQQPFDAIKHTGLDKIIGNENITRNIHEAIERANIILGINKPTLSEKIKRGGVYNNIPRGANFEILRNSVEAMKISPLINKTNLIQALIEREEMMSTGVGHGIAFPHPRNPVFTGEEKEFVSICYPANPIDFGAFDNEKVTVAIFIVCATPKSHLETLSELSKFCSDPEFMKLINAKSDLKTITDYIESKS